MPRPPTHPFWVEQIHVLAANHPRMSGVEIRRKLHNDQKTRKDGHPPTPVPSDRSIRRIMEKFNNNSATQRQPYRYFSWPESMENGLVPWEAGRVILDLMRFRIDAHMLPPILAEAQWFWRVTQAMPDAPIEQRAKAAAALAMMALSEHQPQTENLNVLQWKLAYQPWRSKQDKRAYLQAAKEGRIAATSSPSGAIGLEDAIALFGRYYRTPDLEIFTL